MSDALQKLDLVISDFEDQIEKISESTNIIDKISKIDLKVKETALLTTDSTEKVSTMLVNHSEVIASFEKQIDSFDLHFNTFKDETEKQLSRFSSKIDSKIESQNSALTDFSSKIDSKIESQNLLLTAFKKEYEQKMSGFTHQFTEKVSTLRGESLNAHIDIRHDVENINKNINTLNKLIVNLREEFPIFITEKFEKSDEQYRKIEKQQQDQSEKLSINTKIGIFIAIIPTAILSLYLYLT